MVLCTLSIQMHERQQHQGTDKCHIAAKCEMNKKKHTAEEKDMGLRERERENEKHRHQETMLSIEATAYPCTHPAHCIRCEKHENCKKLMSDS